MPALRTPALSRLLALSPLTTRPAARHAQPSRLAPLLAAGGLTVALAVTEAAVVPASASAGGSVAQFERLASCESGGNWAINTRNGYYGGLQFNLATWRGLGLSGYPHQASKAQQIAAGQKLHSSRGWQPWPACSRKLGLRGNGGGSGSGEAAAVAQSRTDAASRSRRPAPVVGGATSVGKTVRGTPAMTRATRTARLRALRPTPPPAFDGRDLTTRDVRTFRPAVQLWQRRMAARGWAIRADGYFGPRSAAVARAFARGKGIPTRAPGTVTRAVWDAAWTTPVT